LISTDRVSSVLQGEEVVSIKNTLIFIDYSTNFGGGGVELMLTASTNGLAFDDGLDGPETVGGVEAAVEVSRLLSKC
jgi:hypothetical protein